jgi:hypothetical protein
MLSEWGGGITNDAIGVVCGWEKCVDSEKLVKKIEDSAETLLVDEFKLVYLKWKGKKYVPVLVACCLVSDCWWNIE